MAEVFLFEGVDGAMMIFFASLSKVIKLNFMLHQYPLCGIHHDKHNVLLVLCQEKSKMNVSLCPASHLWPLASLGESISIRLRRTLLEML